MNEFGHHLTAVHIPSSPRLMKGSCTCGQWAMIAENRDTLNDFFSTHLLIMRFAPDSS
jgi:hypothetical protein